ncbi:hypothetical protein [Saccharopolyspora pogona]|uniref:hypothetical protein n=1 Tax=Saccharopolyspora pogona TaxID=333966 RepID=UPI0037CB56A1
MPHPRTQRPLRRTRPGQGVRHCCVSNMPGGVPQTATRALTNATPRRTTGDGGSHSWSPRRSAPPPLPMPSDPLQAVPAAIVQRVDRLLRGGCADLRSHQPSVDVEVGLRHRARGGRRTDVVTPTPGRRARARVRSGRRNGLVLGVFGALDDRFIADLNVDRNIRRRSWSSHHCDPPIHQSYVERSTHLRLRRMRLPSAHHDAGRAVQCAANRIRFS